MSCLPSRLAPAIDEIFLRKLRFKGVVKKFCRNDQVIAMHGDEKR